MAFLIVSDIEGWISVQFCAEAFTSKGSVVQKKETGSKMRRIAGKPKDDWKKEEDSAENTN